MYPKHKTYKIIDEYQEDFIKALSLNNWDITFHVYKSGSKKLKEMKMHKHNREGNCGITFIGTNSADVIIFYDQVQGKEDAIATLFHELLHCFFFELTSMITIKQDHAQDIEERLIRILEVLYMALYKD